MAAAAPDEQCEQARRLRAAGWSIRRIARKLGQCVGWVHKHTASIPIVKGTAPRLPDPAPEAGGPTLPEPSDCSHEPYRVDGPGRWLILSDVHIPYHDTNTIRRAVEEARRVGVAGVLLNGDTLDFYQLSKFSRDPSKARVKDEIEKGRQFLAWIRSQFPKSRLIFKEGNHDERLKTYLADRSPELFDLDDLQLVNLLRARETGTEWVADKRAVHLGKLPVFHGHEFSKGQGVNPARWLFLQTTSTGALGHFHRTSEHHEHSYDGRLHGVWSFGCACFLKPLYAPNNKWNHGYGIVELSVDGGFVVTNRRILRDGRVV